MLNNKLLDEGFSCNVTSLRLFEPSSNKVDAFFTKINVKRKVSKKLIIKNKPVKKLYFFSTG